MAETILVIEGDSSVRGTLQGLIENLGYKVRSFQSQDQALLYLELGAAPSVILLELSDASRAGRNIVQRMRLLMPDTDILYTDGCGMARRMQAQGLPVPAHMLELPCCAEDLGAHIRHLLNNQEQRRLLRAATAGASEPALHSLSGLTPTWPTDVQTSVGSAIRVMTNTPSGTTSSSTEQSLRVLLVEDNADTQWATSELLAALGHKVEGAASAEEALAKLADAQFDVLCSDISLPGISGAELAQKVHEQYPSTAIVFASGYGHIVEIDKQRLGAVVLPKPYTMTALQSALTQAVERRRSS